VGAAAAPAQAADSGVTIDPGSPTAKEYRVPLDAFRGEASGGGGNPTAHIGEVSKNPAPAFGIGVHPRGGGATGRRSQAGGAPAATAPQGAATPAAARAASVAGGSSTALWIALAALAVLVPGLVVALVRRRRRA
jgi:hypothetical protein